jgi:hypothetical protein
VGTSGVANQAYSAEAFRLQLGWVSGEKQPFATIRLRYFHSKEIEKLRTCWLSPLSLTELVAIVRMNGVNTGRKWSQVAWVVPLNWNVRGFGLKQCWLCEPWGSSCTAPFVIDRVTPDRLPHSTFYATIRFITALTRLRHRSISWARSI